MDKFSQIKIQCILCLAFFLFGGQECWCQEIIDGPDGNKIIFYPNGTWVPYGRDTERSVYTPDSLDLSLNIAENKAAEIKEKQLSLKLIQKRLEVANLESERNQLQSLSNVPEQELIEARNRLDVAKKGEAMVQESLNKAKEWKKMLESLTYLNRSMRARAIVKWNEYHQTGELESIGAEPRNPSRNYTRRDEVVDLMNFPPSPPCEFIASDQSGTDKVQRRDVRPEVLFSFTDPGLESHFKKQDLITGFVSLTSFSAGKQWLVLEIAIASKQASKLFGGMKENDFIRFTTIDGNTIRLLSNSFDGGYWDEIRQAYIYRNQYPIGAKEYKLLSKAELDSILVRWSKVQEEYQIFDVDVITRQFSCLLNG